MRRKHAVHLTTQRRQEDRFCAGRGGHDSLPLEPTIAYDQGTEDKINQLNQQRAQTSIAKESEETARAQSRANAAISGSVSNDPNVIVNNCINAAIAKGISPFGCWPSAGAVPTMGVPGR